MPDSLNSTRSTNNAAKAAAASTELEAVSGGLRELEDGWQSILGQSDRLSSGGKARLVA